MRNIKITLAGLIFLLMFPGQVFAHMKPAYDVREVLFLIYPIIILLTWIGGGFFFFKTYRDIIAMAFIWVAAMVIYPINVLTWIFLGCTAFAIVRGVRMILWGFKKNIKSKDTLIVEKVNQWRMILGGGLLVGAALLFVVEPLTHSPVTRPPQYEVRSNLHNLFLGCKAYWADNDSSKKCTVDSVSGTTYGYVQLPEISIITSGDETNFSATAWHTDSIRNQIMDHNGSITQSNSLREKPPEKFWIVDAGENIKENLRRLGIL